MWLPADGVERDEDGRIMVYVALHGHGTYPHVRKPGLRRGIGDNEWGAGRFAR